MIECNAIGQAQMRLSMNLWLSGGASYEVWRRWLYGIGMLAVLGSSSAWAQSPVGETSVSGAQGGGLHIHLDDPTFVPTTILIPTRNLGGPAPHPGLAAGGGSAQARSQAQVWVARRLAEFTAQLGTLLTATRFFALKERALYAAPEFLWPEIGLAASPVAALQHWLEHGVRPGQVREDLVLFSELQRLHEANVQLKLYLVDLRVRGVIYQRSLQWSHRQPERLDAFSYDVADDILKLVSGGRGLYSSRIVFVGRKTATSPKQVYTCRMDGSDLKQITAEPVIHLSPSWSPQGDQIIFTSYRSGNPDLYVYDRTKEAIRALSIHHGLDSGGAADPHSGWVAFSSRGRRDADLFVVPPAGGARRLLIRGLGLDVDPTFSRDGRYLAYVSGRFGRPHIFVAELRRSDAGGLQVVQDRRVTWAGWYNGNPAFSQDSRKLAFAGYDKEIDRFDIFLMDVHGQNLERLTLKSGDNESPSWAPNDQHIVFESSRQDDPSTSKGPKQLYVMRRDGDYQTRIPLELYSAESPEWGPELTGTTGP